MALTHDEKILYIARRNKWTLCYLAVICTLILITNIIWIVEH